jgi:hypothetical protein
MEGEWEGCLRRWKVYGGWDVWMARMKQAMGVSGDDYGNGDDDGGGGCHRQCSWLHTYITTDHRPLRRRVVSSRTTVLYIARTYFHPTHPHSYTPLFILYLPKPCSVHPISSQTCLVPPSSGRV